jgi:signal transduction histidine kinase
MLKNLVNYISIASENSKTYKKIKEQKDELVKVNESKDRMFSIIGHDLRGPVGTIKSFLDIIIENPEMANSENTIEILKSMQQSLGSAYTLLDNLLLWARSQRGQLEFEPRPFYIKQPIDEIIGLVSEIARNKEIEIETRINYNELVLADQNMITTVIRNLVSNAIKFTPRHGKIVVLTQQFNQTTNGLEEEKIEIKIIDNGIGIKKEDLDKILEENEIYSTPGTDKETGSGLGIGICIDFLKMHKQKLLVYNNSESEEVFDKGTTFKFYLNRSDSAEDIT